MVGVKLIYKDSLCGNAVPMWHWKHLAGKFWLPGYGNKFPCFQGKPVPAVNLYQQYHPLPQNRLIFAIHHCHWNHSISGNHSNLPSSPPLLPPHSIHYSLIHGACHVSIAVVAGMHTRVLPFVIAGKSLVPLKHSFQWHRVLIGLSHHLRLLQGCDSDDCVDHVAYSREICKPHLLLEIISCVYLKSFCW